MVEESEGCARICCASAKQLSTAKPAFQWAQTELGVVIWPTTQIVQDTTNKSKRHVQPEAKETELDHLPAQLPHQRVGMRHEDGTTSCGERNPKLLGFELPFSSKAGCRDTR